jgi:hypothetical protein
MRRSIVVLASLLSAPVLLHAQQAPPPFTSVGIFHVPVSDSPRFEEAVRGIVDAAGKAKLKARWGWEMWQSDNRYAVVSGLQSMGEMDDPMFWMKQFNNTPGQAALMQAFQKFNGMKLKEESEVMMQVKEWSYMPASGPPQQPGWALVGEYWQVSGSDEQYDRVVKDAIAFLKSINYPFMIIGNRTPVGQRRAQFVIVHSDPARYAAEDARLNNHPQWQALVARFMPLLADMKTTTWRSRRELSYFGTP